MEINESLEELNKKNILKYISEKDIFDYYLEAPTYNTAFSSPFREDKHPSFIIRMPKAYFKDFATGEFGDAFHFVKKLYNTNYNQSLIQVTKDFKIDHKFNISTSNKKLKKQIAKVKGVSSSGITGNFELKVKTRGWKQHDFDYWESYGVPKYRVTHSNSGVLPISHYFINGKAHVADIYAYAYIENKDNVLSYKVYQPFSSYMKFINGNDYSVWELWEAIEKAKYFVNKISKKVENLVITSSRKDALSIMNNQQIQLLAVSLQSESVMPKKSVIEYLFTLFDNIFILYDNDFDKDTNWGQYHAKKITNQFPKIINIKIPDKYKSKDFSDLYFKYGKGIAQEVLTNLILPF